MTQGTTWFELVILLLIVGAVWRFAGWARAGSAAKQPDLVAPSARSSLATFRSLAGCGIAPTGVMMMFVVLSQGPNWDWDLFSIFDRDYDMLRQPAERARIRSDKHAPVAKLVSSATADRPSWTSQSESSSPDVTRVVLSSQLWSTSAEAENELRAKAVKLLRDDFDRRHHGWFDPEGRHCLSESHIVAAAVKQTYFEHAEQDFGSFSSPMNRLWWQVEISPIVRTELYPDWKRALVHNRVLALGAFLSLITMGLNVLGLFATSRGNAQPGALPWLSLLAGSPLFIAWSGGLLFLATSLMK